jgi:hypothetical protein
VEYRYAPRAEGERVRLRWRSFRRWRWICPTRWRCFRRQAARKVQVAVRANVECRRRSAARYAGRMEGRSGIAAVQAGGSGRGRSVDLRSDAARREGTATLKAIANVNGREVQNGMETINYPHFPPQNLFPPSDVKLVRANIAVTARRVGYIMGAGDQMPDALRQLGVEVTLLSQSDLEQGDLSRFDAIVAGVRAYNVRADLKANQARLMNYVKNGGTYIVQYQNADPT